MAQIRFPVSLRSMGTTYALILPRELYKSDKSVKFHSASEARQFFSRFGSDGFLVNSMRSILSRAIPSIAMGLPGRAGNGPYGVCSSVADAVYFGQILLVIPDQAERAKGMMPIAQPRIRVKDVVQAAKKLADQKAILTNPRWEHTDESLKTERPTLCLTGDTVKLMGDVEGISGAVTFHLFQKSDSKEELLEKPIDGTISGTTCSCSWKVTEEIAALEEDSWFEIRHAQISKPTDRVELNIAGEIELVLDFDPKARVYDRYQFTLVSLNKEFVYESIRTVRDDTDPNDDVLSLKYSLLNRGSTYKLLMAKHKDAEPLIINKKNYREFSVEKSKGSRP